MFSLVGVPRQATLLTAELHDDQVLAKHVMHQPVQYVAREPPNDVRSTHKGRSLVLLRSPPAAPSKGARPTNQTDPCGTDHTYHFHGSASSVQVSTGLIYII